MKIIFRRYFFPLLFTPMSLLSTSSYKCLNFNSSRLENFVIPNVPVRCMSYIRAVLSYTHTCVRRTQTRFTCFQFYIPPSAPVQHTRSLSPVRISSRSFARSPSSSLA